MMAAEEEAVGEMGCGLEAGFWGSKGCGVRRRQWRRNCGDWEWEVAMRVVVAAAGEQQGMCRGCRIFFGVAGA